MEKQYPVNYISITQNYSPSHRAVDISWRGNPEQAVYACADGYVERVYSFQDGGNVVRIRYDDGTSSEFMHLKDNSIIVKPNDRVIMGQRVATMGNTGLSYGTHLHLIMRDANGNRINPLDVLYAYPFQTVNLKDEKIVKKYTYGNNYIVQPGDTLGFIANLYGVDDKILASYNNLSNPNLIYPGQILKIPEKSQYIVKRGDTLYSIARRYGTTWQRIYQANIKTIGKNPNLIKPGQILII